MTSSHLSRNEPTPGPWPEMNPVGALEVFEILCGAYVPKKTSDERFYRAALEVLRSHVESTSDLRDALIALRALYDTDEGCRSTPEYIAATAAIAKATGSQS